MFTPHVRGSGGGDMVKKKTKAKRNYKKEYGDYHGKPAQKKRRAERNTSRAKLEKEGRVKKKDGRDVDHKDHDTANQSSDNLRVRKQSTNRGDNKRKGKPKGQKKK